jgi:hypothetical protein
MNHFILDHKTNLESLVVPTGTNETITVKSEFVVSPVGSNQPYLGIYNNGNIVIGSPVDHDNVIINSGIMFEFKRIIDNGTNYVLSTDDHGIEIVSTTYNTITLPTANGSGGLSYILSNGSGNINLRVVPQSGELIDGAAYIQLKRIYDHIQVMSNGVSEWYVV